MKKNKNKFDDFFVSIIYQNFKNSLFNYILRKYFITREIKAIKKITKLKKSKILDVGCGISPVVQKSNDSFYTDVSSNAVRILRKKGYNAFIGSIIRIPVKGDSYDIVCCSEVLEHVKDQVKALKECYRILKDGGFLIITVPMYKYFWMKDDKFVGHFKRFEIKNMVSLLEDAGFKFLSFKKVGSLTERILTRILMSLYFRFFNKNKSSKIFIILLPIWKIFNYLLFILVYISIFFTPIKLSSIILFKAQKR